jgi:hypothetical protein
VRADVDLSLSGALARPAVRGRFTLRDGRMVRNLNVLQLSRLQPDHPAQPLFSFREPPLSRLQLDLALDAAEPFRIENNLVRGSMVPHLHVGGTGAAPLVEGRSSSPDARAAGQHGDVTAGARPSARPAGLPDVDLSAGRVRRLDALTVTGPYDEPPRAARVHAAARSEDARAAHGQRRGARDPSQARLASPVAVYSARTCWRAGSRTRRPRARARWTGSR